MAIPVVTKNALRLLPELFLVGMLGGQARATDDVFQFFAEEAKVITASRRPESIRQAPVAVDVITAEEIHQSGAINLWDLLRFRVGMDVLDGRSVDGNRGVVAIRGYPQEHVRNIQVLLDGRSVYSPFSGGTYWDQLPVLMDDIERIEIVRGPNSAFYGSGAGLGVINIITKKPSLPGVSMQVRVGNQDTIDTGISINGGIPAMAFRGSYEFRQFDGFQNPPGSQANDFQHSHKANIRTLIPMDRAGQLELFTGGSWYRSGIESRLMSQSQFDQNFQMAKWTLLTGTHATTELLSSRSDYLNDVYPSINADGGTAQSRVLQYDEEMVEHFNFWEDRLNSVLGGNYRQSRAQDVSTFGAQSGFVEELWSGYVNQSVNVLRQLQLSAAGSLEHSNIGAGGLEPNYQFASLWTPREDQTFRASYSVAHTVPSLYVTAVENDAPGLHLVGNPNLKPEKLTSYEIGARHDAMGRQLQLESNLFYTRIDDIDEITVTPQFSGGMPVMVFGFANTNQSVARGVELQAKYYLSRKNSLYTNYTYERVTDWKGNAGDVTKNTPAHKLNLGGQFDLGLGLSANCNLGYKDSYFIASDSRQSVQLLKAYWRLDARLAYALPWVRQAELFMAGQNLLQSRHQEFADGLIIERTFQCGISVKFGGAR